MGTQLRQNRTQKLCQAVYPPQKMTATQLGCQRQPEPSHHPSLWKQLSDPSSTQWELSCLQPLPLPTRPPSTASTTSSRSPGLDVSRNSLEETESQPCYSRGLPTFLTIDLLTFQFRSILEHLRNCIQQACTKVINGQNLGPADLETNKPKPHKQVTLTFIFHFSKDYNRKTLFL